jgi:small GTP-binding protein
MIKSFLQQQQQQRRRRLFSTFSSTVTRLQQQPQQLQQQQQQPYHQSWLQQLNPRYGRYDGNSNNYHHQSPPFRYRNRSKSTSNRNDSMYHPDRTNVCRSYHIATTTCTTATAVPNSKATTATTTTASSSSSASTTSTAAAAVVTSSGTAATTATSNRTTVPVSIRDANALQDILPYIPLQDVRNFCFIAHIDHGKSSLSSRILELTGNLGKREQLHALTYTGTTTNNDHNNPVAVAVLDDDEEEMDTNHHPSNDTDAIYTDNNHDDDHHTDPTESTTQSQQQQKRSDAATTTSANSNKERIHLLDTLSVEQQRGITVKASTATMLYRHKSAVGPTGTLLLNMYDTPGHVDFGREVSRSLSFVQGAVLLLDATQGIQAQTWSVHEKVKQIQPTPPKLIIALTKVDLPNARPEHVALTVADWLQYDDPDAILYTSARNRTGIQEILNTVCEQVPSPTPLSDDVQVDYQNINTDSSNSTTDEKDRTVQRPATVLRAQVVDSWYDSRGVNCLIQIVAGQIQENDRISILTPRMPTKTNEADDKEDGSTSNSNTSNSTSTHTQQQQSQQSYSVQEVGIMLPQPLRTKRLLRGQMGYVRFGLRDPRQALPGTILIPHSYANKSHTLQLPLVPYDVMTSATKSVLYASVHPTDANSFDELSNAVERLALNDTGLEVTKTSSVGEDRSGTSGNAQGGPFLGPGLRVGFQGLLHVEVFRQRLQDEFEIDAVVTPPKVPYRITYMASKKNNLKEDVTKIVEDLSEWVRNYTKYHVVI